MRLINDGYKPSPIYLAFRSKQSRRSVFIDLCADGIKNLSSFFLSLFPLLFVLPLRLQCLDMQKLFSPQISATISQLCSTLHLGIRTQI